MKGVRIQAIVRELNNEKIDIVHWSPDAEIFIKRAMSPVTPLLVMVDEESRTASTVVPDDQIQFAIVRRGQNVRLASQLTGYQIEPMKESEYLQPEELLLTEIDELDEETKTRLTNAGYETAESVLDAGREQLLEIEGLTESEVDRILEIMNSYYADADQETPPQENPSDSDNHAPATVPPEESHEEASPQTQPEESRTEG
jgi:N utilization substance protein A